MYQPFIKFKKSFDVRKHYHQVFSSRSQPGGAGYKECLATCW